MKHRVPAAWIRSLKSTLVNYEPWSVLNISGDPLRNATSSAVMQKPASIVFDKCQDNTYRLAQSMTATR